MNTQERYDLIVVGSGPAGLSAASRAQESGLRYVVLERVDHVSDTIYSYQARKYVMAEPTLIPQRGELPFEAGSRESILGAWDEHVASRGLNVHLNQEVKEVIREADGFVVRTPSSEYRGSNVILGMGTQGSQRKPRVEGEDLPHVQYRLVDPSDHADQDILVVGAGDSALEIALALADTNRVSLIVRSAEIVRAKDVLIREAVSRAANGSMTIYYSTTLKHIEEGFVDLNVRGDVVRVPADMIFLKLGADPPRKFFEKCGIKYNGEGPDAQPILNQYYETTVPGLYLIGAASGRDLIKLGMNQGFEVVERLMGRECEPADEAVLKSKLPFLEGTVYERIGLLRDRIPILGAASEEQLREMLLATTVREYNDRELIIRQNDYTNEFMVIASGRVEIRVNPDGAPERVVAELTAGNFFGEMSLISGRRRNASAIALGPTRIIEIPRKAMLKLIRTAPKVDMLIDQAFLIRAVQGYLFPDVPGAVLGELISKATVKSLGKEEVVFREGEPGDAFYLIRNGMVKISRTSGEKEIVLSYLVSGNFFGESALLSDAPRTATVTTIFPSELIRLSKRDFDQFLARYPHLREKPLQKLEERRIGSLIAEATPDAGNILEDLIREEVVMGTHSLMIDDHKCVRCNNCIRACESVHEDGQARLSLTGIHLYNLLAPNSCWQCENPMCMLDCPPDALVRDPRGEVYIKSNCIGCGNCEKNCPYDNIFMVHPEKKSGVWNWLVSLFADEEPEEEFERTLAVKCDLCREIKGGPACVRSCPTGAAIRVTPEEYRSTLEELVVSGGQE
ncbi:MAG TPA: cyclic nucleotide-binding domain-containing protein [Thermoanaerobaculia bacterium]|nr:cyclic nucleotide-binding domain-containing protein [Thermoanaerobaculia bacterium]